MHNKVVYNTMKVFHAFGLPALRFTYFGFAFLAGDSPPLSASEQIAPDGTISEIRMNGHPQN